MISHGTDGAMGGRFAERMLTVLANCRQHGRGVWEFLAAGLRARLAGIPTRSLQA